MYCGSPAKGVLHIDAEHPIDEGGADDDNFVNCVMNFSDYGYNIGTDPNNQNNS